MRSKNLTCLIVGLVLSVPAWKLAVSADNDIHPFRDAVITETAQPPPMERFVNDDKRRLRNYPEQPPTIPHSIAGYEISLRGNKCLSCHSRRLSIKTGAPMVSVTHFMNRDSQVLSDLSPRRYFCTQCHVAQTTATPPIGNEFVDAADLPGDQ